MSQHLPIKALSTFLSPGMRQAQEDFVLANEDKGIFAVADGFGGPVAGSNASKLACESVREFLDKEARDLDATLPFVLRSYFSLAGNVLFNALVHANRKVLHANKGKKANERGGASVIASYMDGDLMAIGSVGAASAWLVRGGQGVELITPRSYARLTDPFASEIPQGKAIPLTALGMNEDMEPEIVEVRVKPGDWLVLHTDGFGAAARDLLLGIQAQGLSAGEAAHEASELLKACQFKDNAGATVVLF